LKFDQHFDLIRGIPVFANLTERELHTVADSFTATKFLPGEIIVVQGDLGDQLYVLKKGSAVCMQQHGNESPHEIAKLKVGSYFGEVCLLLSKPRQATVVAKEVVHTISIDRASFQRLVGPLKDIFDRVPHCYDEFIARFI